KQELTIHLWQHEHAYDPQRGTRAAFAQRVVANAARNLRRARLAQKCDPRRVVSLQAAHDASLEICLAEAGGGAAHQVELDAFWRQLSSADRDLLDRRRTHTVARIARDLKLSRHAVQTRLRRIQQLFEEAGLQDYLETGPSIFARPV